MINFALPEEKKNENVAGVRRKVMAVTTGVLVVYIVAVAALFGWWSYWSRREEKASAAFDDLTRQLTGLSEQEVVVRKLAERLTAINSFLVSRGSVSDLAERSVVEGVEVSGWNYDETGRVVTVATGGDVELVRDYARVMEERFGSVQLDNLIWLPTSGWQGSVGMKGGVR